ncbi:MAG TPA: PAS domain-containing protein [Pyrinomonadaceae bacterium]|nr:PAS domain-containing protein [Pyrinomonadaceae bacterium]
MLNTTRSAWGGYVLAVAAVAVALLVAFALLPFSRSIPFAFFFVPVVVATLYGGLRPGILAIALSVLASGTFILPPTYSLNIRLEGWLQLSVFIGVSLAIAFLTERGTQAEGNLRVSEQRFRQLAENIDQVFWVYDLKEARVVYTNPAYETTWGDTREHLYKDEKAFFAVIHPEDRERVIEALRRQRAGARTEEAYRIVRPDGTVRWIRDRGFPVRDEQGQITRIVGIAEDVTESRAAEKSLREQTEAVETVNRVGQILAGELDLHKLVQALTDAATELTGARFGSFFYNVLDSHGASYMLYTLSGVPRSAFAHFPMPRATDLFGPTFRGEGTIRIDDVHLDPRYGKNSPYHGMPEGHLPVTSYLAVPVISRSGEVVGGLFFGHEEAGVFTEHSARIVEGLAAQAAIAVDNARLFEAAGRERANAEANERYYRFLSEAIPQIVWTARPDGFFDYFNQRWYEYTGMTAAEAEGWGWDASLHPEDARRAVEHWKRSVETGEIYEIEYRIRRAADGQYRWHLGRAMPLRDGDDGDGVIVKWFGTCTDINDRKHAEEQQRFLAEASALLVASLDYEATLATLARLTVPRLADWCTVDVLTDDRTIERLAVAHEDPAKAKLAWELNRLYPHDFYETEGVSKVIRTGRPELYPNIPEELLALVSRDAAHLEILRDLSLKSSMIVPLIAHNRVLGAITLMAAESGRRFDSADLAFAEDLAGRAALAVDNARLYREAQEVNRLKDEFLATLSHELRTPLTAVLGWTRLISTGQLDEATHKRALETIERNAQSQVQLIDDILDVSRIIRGKLRLNVRPTDLAPVIEAAVDSVRPAAEAKGIRLQVVLDPQAGPVSGDPDRLQQVVWNLLSNAIKFTPKEGRVQVLLARINSHLEIMVSDTGPGIKAEFLPYVFDRFRQADPSTTRKHGGLGLGLAIVRHLVELHGGTVAVESKGAGATFRIMLPLLAVHQPEAASNDATGDAENLTAADHLAVDCLPEIEGLRILIVEDEPDSRELLIAVLTQCRADVQAVSNVSDALSKLEIWRPDVLISDIEMPDEDGYELIRRVRALPIERGGNIPAAALTAYARVEDRMRALLAGFQLHIPKPVEPSELITVIASLAGRAVERQK